MAAPAKVPATPWTVDERSAVLSCARAMIRDGSWREATAILEAARPCGGRDAAWLNLRGVVHQVHGEWKLARRCFGKAMRADRQYLPARQNMRRWYELFTFGRSRQAVCLGDEIAEAPALCAR